MTVDTVISSYKRMIENDLQHYILNNVNYRYSADDGMIVVVQYMLGTILNNISHNVTRYYSNYDECVHIMNNILTMESWNTT